MRKTFYIPTHIGDRLRKYRERYECEEQTAIIRLLDAGLTAEENRRTNDMAKNLDKHLENAVFKI